MAPPNYASKIQNIIDKYSNRYSYSSPYTRSASTSEMELMPYVAEEKKKVDWKKKLLQPAEKILDVLNTGQYVTANIGQEVKDYMETGDKVEIFKAITSGISGKEKGDWEDVLFGEWEPETKGGKASKWLLGLAANILLDPTTYMGFGATNAAKGAARRAATDVTMMGRKGLGLVDEIVTKLDDTFDPKVFRSLMGDSKKKGLSYLHKHGGEDLMRTVNKQWNETYKKALRTPADELTAGIKGQASELRDAATSRTLMESKNQLGGEGVEALATKIKHSNSAVDDILSSVGRYEGAGTRAGRFMRSEFGAGERYPEYVKAWDKVGTMFKESKLGSRFAEAVWTISRPGTKIGNVKAAFGVRNPYQQLLHNVEMSDVSKTEWLVQGHKAEVDKFFEGIDDGTAKKIRDTFIEYQDKPLVEGAIKEGAGADADLVWSKLNELKPLMDDWRKVAEDAKDVLPSGVGYVENYLGITRTGKGLKNKIGRTPVGPSGSPLRKRELGWEGNIQREVDHLVTYLGVDADTAKKMVDEGLTSLDMDLKTMLMRRAVAQAKIENKIEFTRAFKEFGVPKENLVNASRGVDVLGLKEIDDPALKGLLFDEEVSKVLEKAMKITASDEALSAWKKVTSKYTSWIKGWLTASGGFHVRNWASNNFIGFTNHGGKWFSDVKTQYEAAMGTMYMLHGKGKMMAQMKKLGVPDHKITSLLKREYNGKTLEELWSEAGRTGLVSKQIMGFDIDDTVEGLAGLKKTSKPNLLNPFSTENAAFKGSHAVGNVVENTPKMQSFLLSVKNNGGNIDNAITEGVLNSKKIFFDYQDLTDFEKDKLKTVIPFYAWARKNLGRQLDNVVNMGDMYSLVPKVENAVVDPDADRSAMPDWMREAGYLPIRPELAELIGIDEPIAWWPNMPYGDLNKLPIQFEMVNGIPIPRLQSGDDVMRDVLSQAHPAIKSVIEFATKKDIFYQSDIGDFRKAPGVLNNNLTGKALGFIDGMLRSVGKELPVKDTDKGIVIDGSLAKILEENIPFLKRIDQWLDLPEMFSEKFDTIMDEVAGIPDSREGLEQTLATISTNLGVKFKPIDWEKTKEDEREEILREAEAQKNKDRRNLPGYSSRSNEYWKNRTERARRLVGG